MVTGIRHKAVLALGCVVVAVVMACGSAAELSFDKALVALGQGQYERAIEDLNEAIRPTHSTPTPMAAGALRTASLVSTSGR